jgi:polyisoprenyl-phosphate glycosyltransferase
VAQCRTNEKVKGLKLSRNFGQNYAITAGLAAARGRYIVVMDCDLQDDPAYISALYELRNEVDIVYTRKSKRVQPFLKNLLGRSFHVLLNWLGGGEFRSDSHIGNYSLLSRRAADAILSLHEYHRHYLGLLRWVGFKSAVVDVAQKERLSGKTTYSFSRLMREAVNGITSQTDRLLYVTIGVGLFFFVASALAALYVVIAYFVHGFQEGWASVFVALLTSTGIILMCLGITGVYVAKVFEQTKGRPMYIVQERVNFEERR